MGRFEYGGQQQSVYDIRVILYVKLYYIQKTVVVVVRQFLPKNRKTPTEYHTSIIQTELESCDTDTTTTVSTTGYNLPTHKCCAACVHQDGVARIAFSLPPTLEVSRGNTDGCLIYTLHFFVCMRSGHGTILLATLLDHLRGDFQWDLQPKRGCTEVVFVTTHHEPQRTRFRHSVLPRYPSPPPLPPVPVERFWQEKKAKPSSHPISRAVGWTTGVCVFSFCPAPSL